MKSKQYLILFCFILIFILCIFFHPIIHIKYWYQCFTNSTTDYFTIADGYYTDNNDNDINYTAEEYFSKDLKSELLKFKNTNLIYIQAFLYDNIENVSAFFNNEKLEITIDTEYYDVFSEDYYIVKTIRIWLNEKNLKQSNNKLDFIVGKKIYSYYFKIEL